MKFIFSLFFLYSVLLIPMAAIKKTRAFAGRGMFFCATVFFIMLWGGLTLSAMKAWGFFGAVISFILTPAIMTPAVTAWELFHAQYALAGMIILFVGWISLLGLGAQSIASRPDKPLSFGWWVCVIIIALVALIFFGCNFEIYSRPA